MPKYPNICSWFLSEVNLETWHYLKGVYNIWYILWFLRVSIHPCKHSGWHLAVMLGLKCLVNSLLFLKLMCWNHFFGAISTSGQICLRHLRHSWTLCRDLLRWSVCERFLPYLFLKLQIFVLAGYKCFPHDLISLKHDKILQDCWPAWQSDCVVRAQLDP